MTDVLTRRSSALADRSVIEREPHHGPPGATLLAYYI